MRVIGSPFQNAIIPMAKVITARMARSRSSVARRRFIGSRLRHEKKLFSAEYRGFPAAFAFVPLRVRLHAECLFAASCAESEAIVSFHSFDNPVGCDGSVQFHRFPLLVPANDEQVHPSMDPVNPVQVPPANHPAVGFEVVTSKHGFHRFPFQELCKRRSLLIEW